MSSFKSYFVGTDCGHTTPEHQTRGLLQESEFRNATLWRRPLPSNVKPTLDGEKLVRYFGQIVYSEATGSMQIVAASDATADETASLVATALLHRANGMTTAWAASPCKAGERAVSVCRYIDDDHLNATVTALFTTELSSSEEAYWDEMEQLVAA